MWQAEIYKNLTKYAIDVKILWRNGEYLEVREAGLASLHWRKSFDAKANLSTGIIAVLLLSYEDTIDKQFKIAAVCDHEQGILSLTRNNGIASCGWNEICETTSSSTIGVVAAEEKIALSIDSKLVKLLIGSA